MPRSLAHGDYSLLIAIESSSRPNSWYRVLADRRRGTLSCDCPPWVFNRNRSVEGIRSCQHTDFAQLLIGGRQVQHGTVNTSTSSPLLTATREQWPGLRGDWRIEQTDTTIRTNRYHVVLLNLALGNGGTATGVVAFANQHRHSETEMISGVAGWAGYTIAAEVARLGGFPLVGQPPEHFRIDQRPTTNRRQAPTVPAIGLADILKVGDMVRPGTNPALIAEETLKMFLGQETYALLERQGFLDVSSVRFADERRVYRLRRDPAKRRERRVRVFRRPSEYWRDFCITRADMSSCPEADFYLTNFLTFLSNEMDALSVVQNHNVFPPYSDGTERETIPTVWRPRQVASIV